MCSCADVGKSCKLGWGGVFPAPWLFWTTGGGLLGVRLVNCLVGLGHYWTVSWRGCLSCSQLTSCLSVSFQSCPTLCFSMNCSLPGSSVHGLLQARILEWVAMPSSRVSSWLGGSNLVLLHWQVGSLPPCDQGSPSLENKDCWKYVMNSPTLGGWVLSPPGHLLHAKCFASLQR